MNTQTERTEVVIAEAGITGDPGRHQLQLDALHAHARELALRLDAVMEFADAFISNHLCDEVRKIVTGDAELTPMKGNAEFHCFKKSGKWYTSARGNLTEDVFDLYTTPAMREQILKDNDGKFPGLSTDGSSFVWLVIPDSDRFGYPLLLNP